MKRAGFTLIELIVSITIFTIVMVTVYGVFCMGIKTWRRGQERSPLQKVRLAFLRMEKELKNTFFFSNRLFKGTSTEVEFPLTVPISDEDKDAIYIVTYSVIEDEYSGFRELIRKEKVYSVNMEEEIGGRIRKLLTSIRSLRFEYAHESSDPSQNFEWQGDWEEDKLPSGVRISLSVNDSDEIYNKIIFLQRSMEDLH